MKKFGIIMMFVASLAFTSCSLMSGGASSPAVKAGGQCSKALIGLYNSYKTQGTVSITNPTDLANIAVVLSSYNDLQVHKDDQLYKSQFAAGMATQGGTLITAANSTAIMNSLINATGIGTNINTASVAEKAQTVQTIISLIKMLS